MDKSTRFRRASDLRYRLIDGEGVVVRQAAAQVLILNDVGARVLDLIDGSRSVDELVGAMLAEFDVDRTELERDVHDFLSEMLASGLIEAEADAAR